MERFDDLDFSSSTSGGAGSGTVVLLFLLPPVPLVLKLTDGFVVGLLIVTLIFLPPFSPSYHGSEEKLSVLLSMFKHNERGTRTDVKGYGGGWGKA